VQRNRQVFIEKWGEALRGTNRPRGNRHRPSRAPWRARKLSQEDCRRKGPRLITPPTTRAAFDPMVHELQSYERNRVFQNAYVKHLTEALEQARRNRKLQPSVTRYLPHLMQ
jgi:hypothetical protein